MEKEGAGPFWKWVVAAGGLYFAYSLGYDDGKAASRPTGYVAYEASPAISSAVPSATRSSEPDEAAEAAAATALASSDAPAAAEGGTSSDDYYYINDQGGLVDASASSPTWQPSPSPATSPSASYAQAPEPQTSPASYPTPTPSESVWGPRAAVKAAPVAGALAAIAVGGCAEDGSCFGDFSEATGRPRTVRVQGYYRRDGTYVRGHYRSR